MESLLSHLPSWAELVSAIPVILSLVMIEGLLSVDNAMGIAAIAKTLPKNQQKLALRLGIIGAYGFRGLCMAFVSIIANNPWLKIFGATYLVYLMCSHLATDDSTEDADHDGVPDAKQRGLISTILAIEFMDLSLSLDNVVAAVALDKRLWVVCTGVFIGILMLRFVAGQCIKLLDRFPILNKTAFLLIGFVGTILLVELGVEHYGIAFHIGSFHKFLGIITITGATLWYSETIPGKKLLSPVVTLGMPIIQLVNGIFEFVLWPLSKVKQIFTAKTVAVR